MHILLRNFFKTLSRFRLATMLNMTGLSLAFASFIVILIQTKYDLFFDHAHPKSERIYRLEVSTDGSVYNALVGRKWAEMIQQKFPQIETTGLRMKYSPIGDNLTVESAGSLNGFREVVHLIHPDFVEVFDFDMVEGSRDAIKQPSTVFLPQSMAQRFYGNEEAVGRKIMFTQSDTTMVVGGVYRDFPRNTSIENVVYYGINPNYWGPWDGWQFNYELYLTLVEGTDVAHLSTLMLESIRTSTDVPGWIKDYKSVRLMPLHNIYYATDLEFDSTPKGSPAKTGLLIAVSILIICVASFNFVNFSVSLVPLRINSINIQKVLGSSVGMLRRSMLFESIGICLIAFLIAVFITTLLHETPLNTYLNAKLDLSDNLDVVLLACLLTGIVGLIAGLYPAIYSTHFSPAIVLKGSFGLSPHGRILRTSLIAFQYIISFILIIAALVMQLQNCYLQSFDTGYKTEQVITAKLNTNFSTKHKQRFMDELHKSTQVKHVAFSQFLFGTGDSQRYSFDSGGKVVDCAFIPVTSEFFDVMDIPVVEGRSFTEGDERNSQFTVIVNKSFLLAAGIEVGARLSENKITVIGAIDNISFRPLRVKSDEPLSFTVPNPIFSSPMPHAYFRIDGDPFTAAEHIKRSIAAIDPLLPVELNFYDEVFNQIYQSEQITSTLITLFSLLAIVISLAGILGLIFFETQYRRKEIGLRKVYGSTIADVVLMFNKKYLKVIGLCFLLAAPVAWWGINEWLKEFAHRTPIYWWVFAVALFIVSAITVLIITLQSLRAAMSNPARTFKVD